MLEIAALGLFSFIWVWLVSRQSHLQLRVRVELMTVVLAIMMAGLYVILKRFDGGLGAVTHLSDRVPWGIWITADLCGVALASGGFIVAATVHVLGLRRFEVILRPTVLTAFIAYLLVAVILVLDLGRPYRFWHPLLMGQSHSVMFEITLCLTLYSLVLAFEFSPVLLERLGWHRTAVTFHALSLPVVIAGVILSTLHQSSFGSLFLIVPNKLSQLWYTPILPLLFLCSAICAGLAVVILESHYCALFLQKQLPHTLMRELGQACGTVLWCYLALKVGDLMVRHAWRTIGTTPWLGGILLIELIGGVLVPAVWLTRLPSDRPPRGLIAASGLVIGGVILNRMNISWLGLIPAVGVIYVPSWMEVTLTIALVLAGGLAFLAVSSFLPVFPPSEVSDR